MGGRVVEGTGLENRRGGDATVGSNPTPSTGTPRQLITSNTMGGFTGFDQYALHRILNLAAWGDYIPSGHLVRPDNAATHDLVRGFKRQSYWGMETQLAFVNWWPVNAAMQQGRRAS